MKLTIRSPAVLKSIAGALENVLVGSADSVAVAKSAADTTAVLTPGMRLGGSVTNIRAMQLSAVWACIHVLAETFASCKCSLYRKDANGHRVKAVENPLHDVVNSVAAPGMPAYYFKETAMTHILTGGNTYSEIVFDARGNVERLNLLMPENVRPYQDWNTGEIFYDVNDRGKLYRLPADKIFHVPGLGYNGVLGYSPLYMARQAVSLGLSAEEFGNSFFSKGALASGVLETEKAINDAGFKKLRDDFNTIYSGVERSGGTMVLPRGVKFSKISIDPEEAQFLESRKYQAEEIARFYRVPLHLIQMLDKATFSNIEQQSLDFYQNTMLPWFCRWEQFANMKLLTQKQRAEGYYVEFDLLSMLRGDSKSRAEMLHIMRQDGVITADEWRAKENMNPLPGGTGDIAFINGNMIPVTVAASKKAGEE